MTVDALTSFAKLFAPLISLSSLFFAVMKEHKALLLFVL